MDHSSIEKWFLFKDQLLSYPEDIGFYILSYYLLFPCWECSGVTYKPFICFRCYPPGSQAQSSGCERCGTDLDKCVSCHVEECSLHYYQGEPLGLDESYSQKHLGHQCYGCDEWICSGCMSLGLYHILLDGDNDGDIVMWLCTFCMKVHLAHPMDLDIG